MKQITLKTDYEFRDVDFCAAGEVDGMMAVMINPKDGQMAYITRQNAKDFFGLVEPPSEDQERRDFETYIAENHPGFRTVFDRMADGTYNAPFLHNAWQGWLARSKK